MADRWRVSTTVAEAMASGRPQGSPRGSYTKWRHTRSWGRSSYQDSPVVKLCPRRQTSPRRPNCFGERFLTEANARSRFPTRASSTPSPEDPQCSVDTERPWNAKNGGGGSSLLCSHGGAGEFIEYLAQPRLPRHDASDGLDKHGGQWRSGTALYLGRATGELDSMAASRAPPNLFSLAASSLSPSSVRSVSPWLRPCLEVEDHRTVAAKQRNLVL
jgi:hypothetical protein